MPELNRTHLDRPEGWSMADEGYKRVIRMDYYGQPYEAWEKTKRDPDLGELWASWRKMRQRNEEFLHGATGLHLDQERQATLITIETEKL